MDIIYIDYSRAFDSVVHSKLIHKFKCYGLQYELLSWIESFLTNDNNASRLEIVCLPFHLFTVG